MILPAVGWQAPRLCDDAQVTDQEPSTSSRRLVRIAWGSFVFLGWTSFLVPALLRQLEARFGVDDAAIGVYYFVYSASYASASLAGGLLTERLGRAVVLPGMAAVMGLGLLVTGGAPAWPVFLLAAVPLGAGGGAIDGGLNGLALAISDRARGRALNLLHLFFAAGALTSPAVVGQLVERGLPWERLFVATGVVAFVMAGLLRLTPMPGGLRLPGAKQGAADSSARGDGSALPLALLAVAIGCYVASEVGVSNWIVRFLAAVPVTVATTALSAFWGGLALGRLFGARYSDRFAHTSFAIVASVLMGIAVIAGVVAPTPELAVLAFAASGFAAGPIFPMIVALGGDLFPGRLAATTGTLTAAAVVGGTIYPPSIGLMSVGLGLAAGLLGAAVLSFVCGGAILFAARTRDQRVLDASLDAR